MAFLVYMKPERPGTVDSRLSACWRTTRHAGIVLTHCCWPASADERDRQPVLPGAHRGQLLRARRVGDVERVAELGVGDRVIGAAREGRGELERREVR